MKNLLFVLVVVIFIALTPGVVSAEDNDWGICTDPKAVNYPGAETLDALKEAGFRPVNDGSCYYLQCDEVVVDGYHTGAYSCDEGTADRQNYNEWVNDLLPGMEFGPAYYGKLIDIGGCTEEGASNWMNPIYWPDYNIVEDGSCVYPEPDNAL